MVTISRQIDLDPYSEPNISGAPIDAGANRSNRSFLIGPDGAIVARYDKIHMFDVDLNGSQIRESDGYRPGDRAVLADTALGRLGLTICYDLRFPHLYRDLARAGAQVIFAPSAFHPVTGAAHWHVLLRARAIETGAFIVAPAQTGTHAARAGKPRTSYGHTLIISPWGEILGDQGTEPGILSLDLELAEVETSRRRIPRYCMIEITKAQIERRYRGFGHRIIRRAADGGSAGAWAVGPGAAQGYGVEPVLGSQPSGPHHR